MAQLNVPDPDYDGAAVASVAHAVDPDGTLVITLAGELDMSNTAPISSTLAALVPPIDIPVAFDLGGLRFMDSSGIALLLRTADPTGWVSLRNVPPLIERVIEATGLSGILRIES